MTKLHGGPRVLHDYEVADRAGDERRAAMMRSAETRVAAQRFQLLFAVGTEIVAGRATVAHSVPGAGRYGQRRWRTLQRINGPIRCRVLGKHDQFPGYRVEIIGGFEVEKGCVIEDVYVPPSAASAAKSDADAGCANGATGE